MRFAKRYGRIRLYDGTGTPYYLTIKFDNGDFSAPLGVPLTEEILILDRDVATADMHYMEGDDYRIMAPLDLTFTTILEDTTITTYLLDWLAAMNDGLATTVNGITLVSTESDSQRDGSNNNPAFADTNKSTCNVEILWNTAGTDLCLKFSEVWFDLSEQTIQESDTDVALSLIGHIYGAITRAAAFTAGTDVTA